ncbi:MAG: PIN domain-containing protein [Limisphaerales bacterium]
MSSISIGEMVVGVERLPDGKKRRRLERAFKFLREDYAGRILDFSEGAAVEWGRLVARAQGQGRNLSVLDSQIEAIAVHFGLTVVTRNGADFFHAVLNPWEPVARSGDAT